MPKAKAEPFGLPSQTTSPWSATFADYVDKVLSITITFDNTPRAITSCTVHKDAGCQYNKLLIGLGEDGSPDSTTKSFTIPVGDTNVPVNAMAAKGIDVIEDVLGLNITAGR